jgi:protein-S-isoprenylcysteine O-methyltransferase Ste14
MTIATATRALPLRATELWLERLRQFWLYDALMRLPILGWAAVIVLESTMRLRNYVETADPNLPAIAYGVSVAARLSTIAFCALIAGTVVFRLRPAARARGIEPRLSALLGTFLASTLVFFPRCDLPLAAEIASILLVVAGNALASIALMHLGRSFSMMAEARRLVTSGMYRLVRHPLYLAEELATIGVLIQFLSGWTVLLCAAHIAFQLRRMQNEESVLARAFPEYTAYSMRTARLLPGIY